MENRDFPGFYREGMYKEVKKLFSKGYFNRFNNRDIFVDRLSI